MGTTDLVERLPTLRLAPVAEKGERRLRFGRMEAAVVQLLLAQRERSSQHAIPVPLSITLDALAEQLGLACHTPAARQRAAHHLQQTIWRANPKLATQDLTIASLCALGQVSYAIFHVSEILELVPCCVQARDRAG